jgi:cytochrome P450
MDMNRNNTKTAKAPDPFREPRRRSKAMACDFQGETVPMILRHADVRQAARDWKTYSSDAPFKVPIPSEEDVRSMRQLPVEVDPPEHTEYRRIVEPFFRRAKTPEMVAQVRDLMSEMVDLALGKDDIELVREFALPLQSRALTYLLNVSESEASIWTGWGTHVFRDGDDGSRKGAELEAYLERKFDAVQPDSDEMDFFSVLTRATYQGRLLTREEMLGFANLTFAGGRDTIINSIVAALHHLAKNPESLTFLREEPSRITHASEEIFRVLTPLTHIGRVCPVDTKVHGHTVPSGGRASLCWASANFDESVFEAPEEVRLDRKPNPHLAFGFGAHLCLGAPHARLLMRSLLEVCVERVGSIQIQGEEVHVENEQAYQRSVGFDSCTTRWNPL